MVVLTLGKPEQTLLIPWCRLPQQSQSDGEGLEDDRELLIFSPHWKTKEAEGQWQWRRQQARLTNTRGRQADEEATALAGQMTQWVKTTKPDDWSLISPWDTCGGWKNWFLLAVLWSSQVCCTWVPIDIPPRSFSVKKFWKVTALFLGPLYI